MRLLDSHIRGMQLRECLASEATLSEKLLNFADILQALTLSAESMVHLARRRKIKVEGPFLSRVCEIISIRSRPLDHHINSCYDPSTNEAAWVPVTESKNPLT